MPRPLWPGSARPYRTNQADPACGIGPTDVWVVPRVLQNSGIMTFLVDQDGIVYPKEPGEKHGGNRLANEYNVDTTRTRVAEVQRRI